MGLDVESERWTTFAWLVNRSREHRALHLARQPELRAARALGEGW
jgi:hypothetical protein